MSFRCWLKDGCLEICCGFSTCPLITLVLPRGVSPSVLVLNGYWPECAFNTGRSLMWESGWDQNLWHVRWLRPRHTHPICLTLDSWMTLAVGHIDSFSVIVHSYEWKSKSLKISRLWAHNERLVVCSFTASYSHDQQLMWHWSQRYILHYLMEFFPRHASMSSWDIILLLVIRHYY